MSFENSSSEDRTRAAVSLDAVRSNYSVLRKTFLGKKIMSVLKADAYGHGISGLAAVCNELTDQFAVASVEEAARLRAAGADKPVLLFGPVPDGRIAEAAALGLTFSVGSRDYAEKLRKVLEEKGLRADCQIKLDTGFNRTGFRWRCGEDNGQSFEAISRLFSLSCLTVTGIYTHLPVPESDVPEDVAFTEGQLRAFRDAVDRLLAAGLDPGLRHVFSTGGALAQKGELFDMVRVGMPVYGQCDSLAHYHSLGLRQALRWTANLAGITELAAGESVGYGRTFTASHPTRLGVVSVGYADGYRRNYQGLEVLCGGRRVPTVGRVCMDFLMVDLTDVPEARVGDEVVLLGSQGSEEITAIEIAAARDSTCGEVTAAISGRVPRYYL